MISNEKLLIDTHIWYTDLITLSCFLYIIPLYLYYIHNVYYLFISGIFSSISSFMYHYHYEQNKKWLYADITCTSISFTILLIDIIIYKSYMYLFFIITSLLFYYVGSGRNEKFNRKEKYEIFHLGWHISIFVLTFLHSYYHPYCQTEI
jgi:hypothetical protein